jgi:predicted AAA+ superfamily ATPase
MQLIDYLTRERGVAANHVLRVQFDEIPSLAGMVDPILRLAWWFENRVLGGTFNGKARAGEPAYLFFDEVQNVAAWAPQLKALVDHHTVRVLVTGSSALRIESGRDSLAGRITSVDLGTLLLREIAGLRFSEEFPAHLPENGLAPLLSPDFWRALQTHGLSRREVRDRSFVAFSRRGGYPTAHANPGLSWPELADLLNETVIERVIQHDLQTPSRGRKRDPHLLEEVFRAACRYAGEVPGRALLVQEVQQASGISVTWERVHEYLKLLDRALLVKLVRPLELRRRRSRDTSKLCLCDHVLRASWLQEVVPVDTDGLEAEPHLSDLAGHIAESMVGYFLAGLPHLDLAHFPQREVEPEVDFVLTIGEKRLPLEVKYRRRIDPLRDTRGLRAFLEKTVYNAPFGILVTMLDDVGVPDPRIVTLSLPSLLLLR